MNRDARLARYREVAAHLARLNDSQLAALLAEAGPAGSGIGGTAATLSVNDVPVFVKSVPLTDLEQHPEHVKSTANLFGLPVFYQYGIGSTGFGAWRELATHAMTTKWVLDNRCQGFPITYHWRALPRAPAPKPTPAELDDLERAVAYWDGSPAIRARLTAIQHASASLVLFTEHIPHTVNTWLGSQTAAGGQTAVAYSMIEKSLGAGVAFMNANGLLHFDAHFDNVLTDGRRVYFADFGLATSTQFDLTPTELTFLRQHRTYDQTYTVTQLVRWLINTLRGGTPQERDEYLRNCADGTGCDDLPDSAARIVNRYARIAVVMSEFYLKLQTLSRTTPYPANEIHRICHGRPISNPVLENLG